MLDAPEHRTKEKASKRRLKIALTQKKRQTSHEREDSILIMQKSN
jgi:hypothetical protein